jgi:hypothetical protein
MPSSLIQYAPYLFLFAAVWVIVSIVFMLRRWKRLAPSFDLKSARSIAFNERWTSGWSEKTKWSPYRGFSNSLWVTIVDGELWVRPHFPFTFVDRDLELTLRSHVAELSATLHKESCVRVTFGDASQHAPLVLRLRDASAFLEQIAAAQYADQGSEASVG